MLSIARMKRLGAVLLLAVAGVNWVAYRHARAFVRFAPPGHRTPPPEILSVGQKIEVLVAGVEVPRLENRRTPRDLGLEYERHVFAGGRGVPLEAWLVPCTDARGTVILFHGHAASKDSQLREASVFHDLGLNAFLVDFPGLAGREATRRVSASTRRWMSQEPSSMRNASHGPGRSSSTERRWAPPLCSRLSPTTSFDPAASSSKAPLSA